MKQPVQNEKLLNVKAYTFEELLNEKGYIIYFNVGRSMLPLLRQRRDIIEIRRKEPGRCKKYDAVLYKRGAKYILHRVLRVLPEGYLIAGDNNTFVERDIMDAQILGVMTRVIRNGKSIDVNTNRLYRCYVHLWCDCYPLRMAALRMKRRVRRMLGKVWRKFFPRKHNTTL